MAAVVLLGSCTESERAPAEGLERPTASASGPDYGPPRVVGRLQHPELTELSGLAASGRQPGILWGHNDSGGGPSLYCMKETGAPCGTWRVDDAEAIDWEDIAAAPGPSREAALYIADIGDNAETRDAVTIYRVAEPAVDIENGTAEVATLRSKGFALVYPDGPHDAEAIVVHRDTGDVYIITKAYEGTADVFVARSPLADRNELEHLATIEIPGLLAATTGASLSPSGDRVILATYGRGYELRLGDGDRFDDIWEQTPVRIDVGEHTQLEAVTYTATGNAIIVASEGAGAPLYSIELKASGEA